MDKQKTVQPEEEIRLYAPGGAPRIVAIGGGHLMDVDKPEANAQTIGERTFRVYRDEQNTH